jgi:hypothetical protein
MAIESPFDIQPIRPVRDVTAMTHTTFAAKTSFAHNHPVLHKVGRKTRKTLKVAATVLGYCGQIGSTLTPFFVRH